MTRYFSRYPSRMKMAFKKGQEMKTSSDEGKMRGFVTSRPALNARLKTPLRTGRERGEGAVRPRDGGEVNAGNTHVGPDNRLSSFESYKLHRRAEATIITLTRL